VTVYEDTGAELMTGGRPHVRADLLDTGVMDLIRRTLITPRAIREMIDIVNERARLHGENQAPGLPRVQRQISSLEKQDANLWRALRTAPPLGGVRRVRTPMSTSSDSYCRGRNEPESKPLTGSGLVASRLLLRGATLLPLLFSLTLGRQLRLPTAEDLHGQRAQKHRCERRRRTHSR
jgi:hypothetical protein